VSLKRAKKLYEDIHLPGMLAADLDDQLLQATLGSGNAALVRDDLVDAAALFQEALAQSPNESQAEEGLTRISRRMDELYREAFLNRDKDPGDAASKFELILRLAAKDSAVYRKAKQQLHLMRP
jgi:hypothetical protein